MADDQYVIHDYFEITPWSIEVRTYDIPPGGFKRWKLSCNGKWNQPLEVPEEEQDREMWLKK